MGKNCQLFPLFYCIRINTLTKEVWEYLPLNIYWLFILLTNGESRHFFAPLKFLALGAAYGVFFMDRTMLSLLVRD